MPTTMRPDISFLLVAAASVVSAAFVQDPIAPQIWPHRIPTAYESAVMGRRILGLVKLGDIATVFPTSSTPESAYGLSGSIAGATSAPPAVAGIPITMMDYLADCEDRGNPTLLAISIATTFRNAAQGSNVTLSLRWIPPYPPAKRMSLVESLISWLGFGEYKVDTKADSSSEDVSSATPDTVPYSAANLPRVSLIGYIEPITPEQVGPTKLAKCFVERHPDAKYWLPGNPIHRSSWARLVVTHVYWVGGFGDRAYIGWIPVEDWNKVSVAEWEAITLPGEKPGWSEWMVGADVDL
ncbi:hypothetical protein Cpir12675_006276 [Ceratocystis pirilliformis]|uniref:CREG-like beta-barrel domain-containing protein n=1 Tax=Ceratocystis pirilliformis TaxID=259994 RepID=A0ABR3YJG3_9PEZI